MSIGNWVHANFSKVVSTSDGEDLRVDCPHCNDHKQHLYISLVKATAHCFKCDWAGSHFQLISDVSGAASIVEILSELKRPKQNPAEFMSVADRLLRRNKLPEPESYELPDWYVPFSAIDLNVQYAGLVLSYALKRMTYHTILRYGMGYCSDPTHQLAFRLIIPVEKGYYQARAINTAATQKYLNPVEEVGNRMFNHQALSAKHVTICEGAFSAIATGQNAIATLGKRATSLQLRRLANSSVEKFTIAYDAGEERSAKAMELAEELRKAGKQVVIRAYAWGDPDECDLYTEQDYTSAYGLESQLISLFHNQRPFNFAYR